MATKEAPIHQNVKDALVDATELDTTLIMRPLRNTERVLKNTAVDRILQKEKDLGDKLQIQDIFGEVAGVYPKIMKDLNMSPQEIIFRKEIVEHIVSKQIVVEFGVRQLERNIRILLEIF